jgi:hypothetical protein
MGEGALTRPTARNVLKRLQVHHKPKTTMDQAMMWLALKSSSDCDRMLRFESRQANRHDCETPGNLYGNPDATTRHNGTGPEGRNQSRI